MLALTGKYDEWTMAQVGTPLEVWQQDQGTWLMPYRY